jgi:collagenase-like PrtC family protease
MLLLDVPFLPDPDYVEFLAEFQPTLYSVHFSLFLDNVPDGRHRSSTVPQFADLAAGLTRLPGPKKYGLLNSRFHHPSLYTDKAALHTIIKALDTLLAAGTLHGITIVDFYLLQALSDTSPEVASQLEAVPGVNCMLDSFAGIEAYCDTVARTAFKPPTKLNLDRSLNRNLPELTEISRQCHRSFPGVKLTLLANEGCLDRCPFKLTHDAQIAFANTGLIANETHTANQELGCIRELGAHPAELFKSPFIRPEDLEQYEGMVEVIKLCGRTLGPGFLQRVVRGYAARRYAGNLLDLMDTMEWLAKRLHVANEALPGDFLARLSGCDKNCRACSYCMELLEKSATPLAFRLEDLRQ